MVGFFNGLFEHDQYNHSSKALDNILDSRLAAASDKVYQLLAHGRWFSPGTPASSTTKTGRHDIAEILLKVAWCAPAPDDEFLVRVARSLFSV
jgi:hypothetical protein